MRYNNKGATEVKYEGRHLITDEVVEEIKVSLPLLSNGLTAISFYIRELENGVQGAKHPFRARSPSSGFSWGNAFRRKSLSR
jgi:hypothetical protein